MPFTHQLYAFYKSENLEWEVIFALNLGFNQIQPIIYELVYIIEVWLAIFGVCFVACSDLLYACIIQILAMEFDILGQIINEVSFDNDEDEANKELKQLINIHQELIEISENLDEIFSPILLINSFGTIASLCTACFLSVVNLKLLKLNSQIFEKKDTSQ